MKWFVSPSNGHRIASTCQQAQSSTELRSLRRRVDNGKHRDGGLDMDKDKVKAFTNQMFGHMAGAMAMGLSYVGTKTGLFRTMAGKGPLTIEQVVADSGLKSRTRLL